VAAFGVRLLPIKVDNGLRNVYENRRGKGQPGSLASSNAARQRTANYMP